jgi:protease-4
MMIADELKASTLPTAAFVFDMAASAAYLAASGADTIIATPMADVGSIGVTMSYLQNTKQNASNGLDYVELTSAKFKDTGSPDRPLTSEEKAMFQRDLDLAHGEFVSMISENRN